MFSNYFYLSRAVNELESLLRGSTLIEAFSQEKNLLFLHVPNEEFPQRHLIVCTNPQSPYLLLKTQHNKAKKNVADFFPEELPSKIMSVKIASDDRIIKFELESGNLVFSVSGKKTNIYFICQNGESSFKKSSVSIKHRLEKADFIDGGKFNFAQNIRPVSDLAELKNEYPMISSEIRNEIKFRKPLESTQDFLNIFRNLVDEIFTADISVGYSSDLEKTIFIPHSFQAFKLSENFKVFDKVNDALQYYLRTFHIRKNKDNYKKDLNKYFETELARLAGKLNKLRLRIDSGSKEDLYYSNANALLGSINDIKKGMDRINIKDSISNEEKMIKIDPTLSPHENVDKYFEKAKDEKVSFKKSAELFKFTEQKYNEFKREYNLFLQMENTDELKSMHERIFRKKEKMIKMDTGLKFKYWHYIIDEKYNIYVGRDSKSNDYLSIKFAKQNDYWFHARGMPGSHVVLKVDNTKEIIPKNIIKNAASLAAYHSKAKTAGTASVSYTFAKFVYKKKGMAPGKVFLSKEKTLLVKPEIPKNCRLADD